LTIISPTHHVFHAEPPPVLVAQLFPWVEQEQAALLARQRASRFARDTALHHFLQVLVWFCTVLLQDAAIMYSKYPDSNIFSYIPFNSPVFRTFSASSTARIKEVEEAASMAFKNLPENLANGLRNAVATMHLGHQQATEEHMACLRNMQENMLNVAKAVDDLAGSRSSRRRSKTFHGRLLSVHYI
jgi:hypothetical protein